MQKCIHRVRDAYHVSGHRYSEIGERQLVGVILDDEDHRLGERFLDAGAVHQTLLGDIDPVARQLAADLQGVPVQAYRVFFHQGARLCVRRGKIQVVLGHGLLRAQQGELLELAQPLVEQFIRILAQAAAHDVDVRLGLDQPENAPVLGRDRHVLALPGLAACFGESIDFSLFEHPVRPPLRSLGQPRGNQQTRCKVPGRMGSFLRHAGCILRWLSGVTALAQEYPAPPIRLIVPIGAGGGTDILARHVAQKLGDRFRQAAIVENRPGAGSLIGTEYVAKAAPDGYTLLVGGIFNMVMNRALLKNLTYEPLRDFVPLGYISAYPFVLVARADLPGSSLKELVQYAKERPGKLTYRSAGLGTLQHVWGTILFKSLGLDMVHVPFKGAPAAHQEMLAGRLDVMLDNLSAAKHHVQAGRLKAFAVSSASRSPQLDGVPTINETGLLSFEGESWFALFAPAGTPGPVVATLRSALAEITRDAEFAGRVERDGGRVLAIPPERHIKFLQEEIERWSGLVTRYGVTVD